MFIIYLHQNESFLANRVDFYLGKLNNMTTQKHYLIILYE